MLIEMVKDDKEPVRDELVERNSGAGGPDAHHFRVPYPEHTVLQQDMEGWTALRLKAELGERPDEFHARKPTACASPFFLS